MCVCVRGFYLSRMNSLSCHSIQNTRDRKPCCSYRGILALTAKTLVLFYFWGWLVLRSGVSEIRSIFWKVASVNKGMDEIQALIWSGWLGRKKKDCALRHSLTNIGKQYQMTARHAKWQEDLKLTGCLLLKSVLFSSYLFADIKEVHCRWKQIMTISSCSIKGPRFRTQLCFSSKCQRFFVNTCLSCCHVVYCLAKQIIV